MKKPTALVLAIFMLLALAACGGSSAPDVPRTDTSVSNSQQQAPSAVEADASAEDEPSAGNLITVWCWDPTFNIFAMNEAGKIYKQTNPDFEVNIVEVSWVDIQERINTAGSAGDFSSMPDILLCQNNAYQKNTINHPGLFVDLTDSGIAFDKFGESSVAYSVVNGKNYGVPFDNGAAINAVRTDVLRAAGYTAADLTDITWSRYIEIGKDVLAKTGKPMLSGQSRSMELIAIMLQSAGSSFFNADGTPNIADNAVLRESIGVYRKLKSSGVIVETDSWDEYIDTFVSGDVAGVINGCWILGSVQTAKDQTGLWTVTNLPKLNVAGATNYSANGGSSWGITSNCKNPELAADFLSKTFAGSVPLYETILSASGALANYLPAGGSQVYEEPQPFFASQPIYSDIVMFSGNVPSNITGAYYYEALRAVGDAVVDILSGKDMTARLKTAQDEVNFIMEG